MADDGFGNFAFDGGDELSIDIDTLYSILDEKPGTAQGSQGDPSSVNSSRQDGSSPDPNKLEYSQFQNGSQVTVGVLSLDHQLCSLGSSHTGAGVSRSSDYQGKAGLAWSSSSPADSCSASLKDWFSLSYRQDCMVGASHSEMPSCSMSSSSTDRDSRLLLDHGDSLVFNYVEREPGTMSRQIGGRINSKSTPGSPDKENSHIKSEYRGGMPENGWKTQGFNGNSSAMFNFSHNSNFLGHSGDQSSLPYNLNTNDSLFAKAYNMSHKFTFEIFPNRENLVDDMKSEVAKFPTDGFVEMEPMVDSINVRGQNFKSEDCALVSTVFGNSLDCYDRHYDGKALTGPFCYNWLSPSQENRVVYMKDEPENNLVASESMTDSSVEGVDEFVCRKSYCGAHGEDFVAVTTMVCEGASLCQDFDSRNNSMFFDDDGHLNSNATRQYEAYLDPGTPSNEDMQHLADKMDVEEVQPKSIDTNHSKVGPESIQSNSLECRSWADDDPDVCIIENYGQPARSNQPSVVQKPAFSSQNSVVSQSYYNFGGARVRLNKEQMIFQAALKDLSQPKSEAAPPDGSLAVPLLRHQRIALSWMVQKETSTLHCSGGILADDQGLGKTVSTIALILKERPSLSQACQEDAQKDGLEILNLDNDNGDVDGASKPYRGSQESVRSQVLPIGALVKSSSLGKTRGRPAAGTLIVCPTSVLRQWAEELRNKVTKEAKLSILVYHGSNRTKDRFELAKYDVVLTTYSIVSMEVPRQPLIDGDDNEKGNFEGDSVSPMASCSNRKRKIPPGYDKKGPKHNKGMDSAAVESLSGPLAKVSWFRVVLDEAQSIKNHRTQVARACWGLRAKRRWCLSGTPIQNAIDDLYSYFRFLKYDPYAAYSLFCSTIKNPISRNPTKGYQKLQAVLKTIMLRRTKGTLLNGEPIISLPPKIVELRKVDFTKEERDFYSRLECDSRDQFKEYAEAGTVKQNYVNLLLMLLRLRQACDHPLLVKGFDSSSIWKSSVEMAKKLPSEKKIFLLSCLEASLAICGICNDAPEDAVVSACGHVFCKQCICEHLTGDDNQCPVTNCKVRVSLSSIFSKATLECSLSGMDGVDSSVDCSASSPVGSVEPCSEDLPFGSSKIKAALEVLQSLSRPQNLTLANNSTQNSANGNDRHPENSSGLPDKNVDSSVDVSVKLIPEKAIVFSQWTKMLDLLETCLKKSSIQYRRLDGTMSVLARDKAVKDFNTLPEVCVMIMSLKAASLGLNMVAACHVLLLDLWWNPTTEDQAIDRAHRIGQTRPVTVVRLTVKDTVEDRILALQQKKRAMVSSAFGEDEKGSRQSRLTVDDLRYLFMDS